MTEEEVQDELVTILNCELFDRTLSVRTFQQAEVGSDYKGVVLAMVDGTQYCLKITKRETP
jgi:hypothetical protein